MKDLRMEVRFKNNNLYRKIFAKYSSVTEFCTKHNLFPGTVGGYLNLKNSPISKKTCKPTTFVDGYYIKKSALDIATALDCKVFDIFPAQLWDVVSKVYSIEVDSSACIPYNDNKLLTSLDNSFSDAFDPDEIPKALATLLPREEFILIKRFGLDNNKPETLKEIGNRFGVQAERIRQIEARALRKLRNPTRRKILKKGDTNLVK